MHRVWGGGLARSWIGLPHCALADATAWAYELVMLRSLFWFIALSATSAHAQLGGGPGIGGGGLSGMGNGNFGGAAVARVTVAPVGGGAGFQNGGGGGGGGGLHGGTRRTFLAEPKAAAAHYFKSGGVRVPAPGGTGSGGQAGAGTYLVGARLQPGAPVNGIAVATVGRSPAAAPPEPPPPFAPRSRALAVLPPPGAAGLTTPAPATLAGITAPGRAPARRDHSYRRR